MTATQPNTELLDAEEQENLALYQKAFAGKPAERSEKRPAPARMWTPEVAGRRAKALLALGYHVVSILPYDADCNGMPGKSPGVRGPNGWYSNKNWNDPDAKPTFTQLMNWKGRSKLTPNWGVVFGAAIERDDDVVGNVTGIDIDADDSKLIDAIWQLIGHDVPKRIGRKGCTFPIILASMDYGALPEWFTRDKENAVQLLKTGKQSVFDGVHPATERLYTWLDRSGDYAAGSLPAVEKLPVLQYEQLAQLLIAHGYKPGAGSKSRTTEEKSAEDKAIAEAMQRLAENDWPDFSELFEGDDPVYNLARVAHDKDFREATDNPSSQCSKNRWKFALALLRKFPDMTVEQLASFFEKTEGCGTFAEDQKVKGTYEIRCIARDWARARNSVEETAVKATASAERASEAFGDVSDNVVSIEEARAKREVDDLGCSDDDPWIKKPTDEQSEDVQIVKRVGILAPFKPSMRSPNAIAPRPFIDGRMLLKGAYTVLVAPGGKAKSLLLESKAIDLCIGKSNLGSTIKRPHRVFVFNGEDSQDELDRRLGAYVDHHKFTDEQRAMVQENLWMQSGVDSPFKFATMPDGRAMKPNNKLIREFEAFIADNKIEAVLMDPFVTLHSVEENDNSSMDDVANIFKNIAARTNAALMIAHHTRKSKAGAKDPSVDATDSRGATALVNASRGVFALNDVPEKRCGALGVPKASRFAYLVFGPAGKNNYEARGDASDVVLKLNTHVSDNGTEDFEADRIPVLSLHKAGLSINLDTTGGNDDEEDDLPNLKREPFKATKDRSEDRALQLVGALKELRGDKRFDQSVIPPNYQPVNCVGLSAPKQVTPSAVA